jgi:cyclic pyranopterin phosphate synthase
VISTPLAPQIPFFYRKMMPSRDPDNFCYYPFMQLLLQPTGVVSPCCWNQGIVLGQIPYQTLDEIWNGESLRRLRREFLDGKPIQCEKQMRHIGCHKWSLRDDTHRLPVAEILQAGPLRLDVRLNGKCNLQCVMCDVWKQPNGVYDKSDFWTTGPTKIFPFLKEVDILGGEPFVQGDTFRLIDEVTKVNQTCSWAIVTNGSYVFGPPIRRRLDKINIRWLQISLDSINPKTYSQVRVGGSLEKTLAALDAYRSYAFERRKAGRGFRLLVTMCVQQLNWREIGSFLRFGRRFGLEPQLQFAYDPASVSLLTLPSPERRRILDHLWDLTFEFGTNAVNPIFLPLQEAVKKSQIAAQKEPEANP